MIFVIDDNLEMSECIARAIKKTGHPAQIFTNAIDAMAALGDTLPEMIFLDVLLTGPDGFTFLNELISYPDTAKIPVVLVSSLDLTKKDLSIYGVVGTLHKDTMTPQEIEHLVQDFAGGAHA